MEMCNTDLPVFIDACIKRALSVQGGHLFISHNGYALYHAPGQSLMGFDCTSIKARCIAAGVPVIDCRHVWFTGALQSCLDWPTIAVGNPEDLHLWPTSPQVPLADAAAIYRQAGAEVVNVQGGA